MKKILLLAIGIIMCTSAVQAQPGGNIGLYWDLAGTNCYGPPAPGLCYVYAFHEGIAKAGASQFKLQAGGGWAETYVAFGTVPYLNILSNPLVDPSPFGGVSIAYGNPLCEPLPALIMTVTMICTGVPICGFVQVVADPFASIPNIEVRDCSNNAVVASGGIAYLDATATNNCGPCTTYVGNEEQTWGQIKALYQ